MGKLWNRIFITLYRRLIRRCVRYRLYYGLYGSDGVIGTRRYEILWPDERWLSDDRLVNPRPWYLPFNMFIHKWFLSDEGLPHDHPRWTITIVLTGRLKEELPDRDRWLMPGSIVFRSRKAIHRIKVPPKWRGKTRTLFIVGRRRWHQNYYESGRSIDTDLFP